MYIRSDRSGGGGHIRLRGFLRELFFMEVSLSPESGKGKLIETG